MNPDDSGGLFFAASTVYSRAMMPQVVSNLHTICFDHSDFLISCLRAGLLCTEYNSHEKQLAKGSFLSSSQQAIRFLQAPHMIPCDAMIVRTGMHALFSDCSQELHVFEMQIRHFNHKPAEFLLHDHMLKKIMNDIQSECITET